MIKYAVLGAVLLFCAANSAAGTYKVTHLDRVRVFEGTTMLADMSDPKNPTVVEVDFKGTVLWKYSPPGTMSGAVLEATPIPNGNVLITIAGSGIFEISRSRQVVWSHRDPEASHDADRLPDGNTLYNLGWQKKGEDVVREVTPDREVIWAWNGLADYDREPFAGIDNEGWMHVNAVTRLKNGNTLVSMRNFNTVAEVGPDGRVVRDWTFDGEDKRTRVRTYGKIKGERNHEPEVLDNGNILLALRRPNRFVEFDPDSGQMIWQWRHPEGEKALRTNREANRLPNGNTLGTAWNKIIEIAPDGTIVWQMMAPSGGANHRKFHKAIRIAPDGSIFGG